MICFNRIPSALFMKLFRYRRAAVALGFLSLMVFAAWHLSEKKLDSGKAELWQVRQACKHPILDPFHPMMMKFVKRVGPIVCDGGNDWVVVEGDTAYVTKEALEANEGVECNFTDVKRISDFLVWPVSTTYNKTRYMLTASDFVRVKCRGRSGQGWSNILAGARSDQELFASTGWDSAWPSIMKLNVIIFGFDSVSRLNFLRQLPLSYEFLMKEMDTTVLTGYNIVGDGTPQAIIPILTGKTERELPEARRRRRGSYVDAFPFIWSDFRDAGYVTGYLEDTPKEGIFTYRLRGFKDSPTDFYMRTFFLDAEANYYHLFSKHCLGSRPRHKVMMDYIKSIFKVYKDRPKFVFGFHGEISHNDMNLVGAADVDLLAWLKWYKEEHFKDTILILMSDHGLRFGDSRDTQQGKLEERQPFFSFTFPPSFSKRYPDARKNFKTNANRLTTPFDIYATLTTILNPSSLGLGNLSARGISLFQEVPPSRTCADAFIEPHWCACLEWLPESTDDPYVYQAGLALTRHINAYNAKFTTQCEIMALKQVTQAAKLVPSTAFKKFRKSKDYDGLIPDMSANTAVSAVVYQIKIVTDPGPAIFEAAVTLDKFSHQFTIKIEEISRLNKYGRQARCVENTFEQLRKFCYCKD